MKPRCLETRRNGLFTMRRYRHANGRVTKTMEMPWTVWLAAKTNVIRALNGYVRAEERRGRIAKVKTLLVEGHKREYIAEVVGISRQRVGAINTQMKRKK